MTETSPVALGNPLTDGRRPGTLGLPFPSTQIRVVDPTDASRDVPQGERGELLIRGPQVFAGYWQRPDETSEQLLDDGWLRTGDVVTVDETGWVVLVDRLKELIVSGGFKVYPSQVEDQLRCMPGVEDVAVVGVPGGDLGETVVAVGGARPRAPAASTWTRCARGASSGSRATPCRAGWSCSTPAPLAGGQGPASPGPRAAARPAGRARLGAGLELGDVDLGELYVGDVHVLLQVRDAGRAGDQQHVVAVREEPGQTDLGG